LTVVLLASVLVAGGVEMLGLIGNELNLSGRFWDMISDLNDRFGTLDCLIIGIFVMS
jgi:nickel/cobalt transporter (NiCoT) family protein